VKLKENPGLKGAKRKTGSQSSYSAMGKEEGEKRRCSKKEECNAFVLG